MSEFGGLRKHEKTQHALYWQKDKCTSVQYSSDTSLVIGTLSSAHWQLASKITTLLSTVSSFPMKNSTIQKLSGRFTEDTFLIQFRFIACGWDPVQYCCKKTSISRNNSEKRMGDELAPRKNGTTCQSLGAERPTILWWLHPSRPSPMFPQPYVPSALTCSINHMVPQPLYVLSTVCSLSHYMFYQPYVPSVLCCLSPTNTHTHAHTQTHTDTCNDV